MTFALIRNISNAGQEIRHASRIYIRFINWLLSSLKIQYCYRGAYFIDRTVTWINQQNISPCDIRLICNLGKRRKKEECASVFLLVDFISLYLTHFKFILTIGLFIMCCILICLRNQLQKRVCKISCEFSFVSFLFSEIRKSWERFKNILYIWKYLHMINTCVPCIIIICAT